MSSVGSKTSQTNKIACGRRKQKQRESDAHLYPNLNLDGCIVLDKSVNSAGHRSDEPVGPAWLTLETHPFPDFEHLKLEK